MKKMVVFIDDELQKEDLRVIKLKEIVEDCGFSIRVLNEKEEIESFIDNPNDETGMVLLDRDLSKIECHSVSREVRVCCGNHRKGVGEGDGFNHLIPFRA